MNLTAEQLFTLQDACTARAEQLLQRSHLFAADSVSADYWKQEAAAAHQLALLFKDAIKVEITTAALETPPAAEPAAPLEDLTKLQARLEDKKAVHLSLLSLVRSAVQPATTAAAA